MPSNSENAALLRDSYIGLADEMNDADVGPWNEADWDAQAVKEAKLFAKKFGFSWPPQHGDFDRWYEKYGNCDGTRSHEPGLCEACDDAFAELRDE